MPDTPTFGRYTEIPYEQMTPEQERFYLASQWRMMWWRFRRHRLAVVAGVVLLIFYATIFVSEFLSPYALHTRHVDFIFAPPQGVHLFDDKGNFVETSDVWWFMNHYESYCREHDIPINKQLYL